ncbi:tRNA (adenosine(37)-N6)-threonylcarbamoyltransferase complex transferase subunit TsaD [Patescibacteria group bacterium]
MIILGIETSCDETAVSLIKKTSDNVEVLSNAVSSQVELHAAWGGVVPNLAAREHLKNILPVLEESLSEAQLTKDDVDLISVTQGPGLIPALLVGTNFAKTLSYLWKKPLIGIHHIEGHIYANFIGRSDINFPVLALVVSGGHTQLVLMRDHLNYEVVGETQDDAVGEAFDKVARTLDLGYPGGPIVSQKAEEFKSSQTSNPESQISLPRPMLNSPNFNFSFSGLKTAVLYKVKELKKSLSADEFQRLIPEICHEFQQACIDVLIHKTLKATKKYSPKSIVIAGGVSANTELKKQLEESVYEKFPEITYSNPDFTYSLDNAAMIASAASFRWGKMTEEQKAEATTNWKTLQANAGLSMN